MFIVRTSFLPGRPDLLSPIETGKESFMKPSWLLEFWNKKSKHTEFEIAPKIGQNEAIWSVLCVTLVRKKEAIFLIFSVFISYRTQF